MKVYEILLQHHAHRVYCSIELTMRVLNFGTLVYSWFLSKYWIYTVYKRWETWDSQAWRRLSATAELLVRVGELKLWLVLYIGLNWCDVDIFCIQDVVLFICRPIIFRVFSVSDSVHGPCLDIGRTSSYEEWRIGSSKIATNIVFAVKPFVQYTFKQSVLVYKCLHGSAPVYLTDELCQVADVEARQRLCSSSSSSLIVSRTRLLTVGDRAFPVAAARVWNSLPDLVTSAPSVAVFRSRLKTHLFNISYLCDCIQCLRSYSSCFGIYNRSCLFMYLLDMLSELQLVFIPYVGKQ